MAIEYVRHEEGIDYLLYRRPEKKPRDFIIFRALLIAAAVFALVNIVTFLGNMLPVLDASEALLDDVNRDPRPEEAELRDLVAIFSNSTNFLFLVVTVTMFVIPGRYVWLIMNLKKGHPRTRDKIRTLATISLSLELFIAFAHLLIFSELETLHVPYRFGVNMLLAPAILVYAYRPDIRRFFSYHRVRAQPEGEPAFEQVQQDPPAGFIELPPDPTQIAPDSA